MNNQHEFKSVEHRERFIVAMNQAEKIFYEDRSYDAEYASALYILTADQAAWNKAQEYVSHSGIDFSSMLEEIDFSGGYSVLILLAGNLFNGQQHVDPLEFLRLDDDNFGIAMAAIKLRRG